MLAYEAVQQLRRKGETVQLVILIDTVFPNETYRATGYGGPMALISVGARHNQWGWVSDSEGNLKVIELSESDMGELAHTLDLLRSESSC